MNQWVRRIESNAIFKELEQLRSKINEAAPLAEAINIQTVEALDRVAAIAEHLDWSLKQVDPVLTPPSWLEGPRPHVQNCTRP